VSRDGDELDRKIRELEANVALLREAVRRVPSETLLRIEELLNRGISALEAIAQAASAGEEGAEIRLILRDDSPPALGEGDGDGGDDGPGEPDAGDPEG
jgi:hypothetical protein